MNGKVNTFNTTVNNIHINLITFLTKQLRVKTEIDLDKYKFQAINLREKSSIQILSSE